MATVLVRTFVRLSSNACLPVFGDKRDARSPLKTFNSEKMRIRQERINPLLTELSF
jgi:hypothetical protein